MDYIQKLKRRNPLAILLNRSKETSKSTSQKVLVHNPPQIGTSTQATQHAPHTVVLSPDQKRTADRYRQAAKLLEEATKDRGDTWGVFNFSDLKGEPQDFNDSQFKDRLNAILEARKAAVENTTGWAKSCHAMPCAFAAFSPFATNFLTLTKGAYQSVSLLLTLSHIDFKSVRAVH